MPQQRAGGQRGGGVAGRWGARVGAPGLLGLAVALTLGEASAREPRSSAVLDPAVAVAGLAEPCRTQVAGQLRRGEGERDGCVVERRAAQRQLLRAVRPRPAFGLVERTRPGLGRVSLLLSEARGCREWPLRTPGRATLGLFEARAAGCWVRRYAGELVLTGVMADGRRVPRLEVVRVDDEGHVDIDLVRLTASLDRRGMIDLDSLARLDLGAEGWAGSIDLAAVRAALADWHAASVQRGRGVPALLVVRHPDHPSADNVRGLALAAALRRQEADFRAVQRGELAPHRFLERHAWSPYRQLVAAMLAGGE